MARLRPSRPEPQGNQHARRKRGARCARLESVEGDPKPVDLCAARLKPRETGVEDRPVCDVQILRLSCVYGVKVQSRLGIAGSTRDCPQADLSGGGWRGRALITGLGRETSRLVVKLRTCHRRRWRAVSGTGVSLYCERGTTQTVVKVPKCRLSVT